MKLYTRTSGSGPRTAALLHGASMTHDIWRDFGQILQQRHDIKLLLVDQRGHGASPRADSYAIDDFAADAVETLPQGLDFIIGQSLGGRVGAMISGELKPGRYIGLDPAFTVTATYAGVLKHISPHQKRFPEWLLRALMPHAKEAPADTIPRIKEAWRMWDASMMTQLVTTGTATEFMPCPPPVPSTIVLAERSMCVSAKRAEEFRALGWDVRVKPAAIHDLHVQDPQGLSLLLDDVLRSDR
ncbi:MAG: alpha/beta hydrolase [Tetrasphaera sp.]|nr:alpha/beta hydrolase [Tetrasphaera sp.]